MARHRRPKVAFVLSGGGSLGAIQAGMLGALYEREVHADLLVGTSAGALNGAFIASRPQTVATADALGDVWRGLRRGQAFPLNPLTGLLGFLGARKNLVPATPLRRLISRYADCEQLEELPTELHVIACDMVNGEEVRLSEGPLVDGGALNNTPVAHALDLGADEIYVLSAAGPCALDEPPRGALGMVVQATTLMVAHRFAEAAAALAGRSDVTVVPPPCPIHVSPMDFRHTSELIAKAEAAAGDFLDARERERVVPLRREALS